MQHITKKKNVTKDAFDESSDSSEESANEDPSYQGSESSQEECLTTVPPESPDGSSEEDDNNNEDLDAVCDLRNPLLQAYFHYIENETHHPKNDSFLEDNPIITYPNKFVLEKKPIETDSDKCVTELQELNPTFFPWSSFTSAHILEFRTMLWYNLTGLFKGKFYEMMIFFATTAYVIVGPPKSSQSTEPTIFFVTSPDVILKSDPRMGVLYLPLSGS